MPSNRFQNHKQSDLSEICISKCLTALTTIVLIVSLDFWLRLVSRTILDELECILPSALHLNSLWVPVLSSSLRNSLNLQCFLFLATFDRTLELRSIAVLYPFSTPNLLYYTLFIIVFALGNSISIKSPSRLSNPTLLKTPFGSGQYSHWCQSQHL